MHEFGKGGNNLNIKERGEDTKQSGGSTFLVKVIFTQNASMQGFVQWIEKERHFLLEAV